MSSEHPVPPEPDRVFVVGEALVDVVVEGGTSVRHPGGSPLNVAYGLARLGVPTTFRTQFGIDPDGHLLQAHLDSVGVDVDPASLETGSTSTALARIGEDGSASYEFDLAWAPGSIDVPDDATVVHTGSIASVLAPGADDVLRLLEGAGPSTLLTFDPNARPGITPDRAAVAHRVGQIASLAHVVKMSDEDAGWLHPDLNLETVVEHYLSEGATVVAITRGGDGCLIGARGILLSLPSLPVKVVDTIGAGDSFMSGVIAAILQQGLKRRILDASVTESDLTALAAAGLRSARITVSRAGANPPSAAELEAGFESGARAGVLS